MSDVAMSGQMSEGEESVSPGNQKDAHNEASDDKHHENSSIINQSKDSHVVNESSSNPNNEFFEADVPPKKKYTEEEIIKSHKNIITLSVNNKINSKNAFDLDLIDFMADFLRTRQRFQAFEEVGVTLDAGGKIYAHRVEVLFSETRKILGELVDPRERSAKAQRSNEAKKARAKALRKSTTRVEDEAKITKHPRCSNLILDALSLKIVNENELENQFGFFSDKGMRYESDLCHQTDENSLLHPINETVPGNILTRTRLITNTVALITTPLSYILHELTDDPEIDDDNDATLICLENNGDDTLIQRSVLQDSNAREVAISHLTDAASPISDGVIINENAIPSVYTANSNDLPAEKDYNTPAPSAVLQLSSLREFITGQLLDYSYFKPGSLNIYQLPTFWHAPIKSISIKRKKTKPAKSEGKRKRDRRCGPPQMFAIDFDNFPTLAEFEKTNKTKRISTITHLDDVRPLFVELPYPGFFHTCFARCNPGMRFIQLRHKPVIPFDLAETLDYFERLVYKCNSEIAQVWPNEVYNKETLVHVPTINETGDNSVAPPEVNEDVKPAREDILKIDQHSHDAVNNDETLTPSFIKNEAFARSDSLTTQSVPPLIFPETDGFITRNLIEAPVTVKRLALNYARRRKVIDMKVMKSKIKCILDESSTEIIPQAYLSEEAFSPEMPKSGKSLTNLYRKASSKDDIKADLSPAIAFAAVLHLANEFEFRLLDSPDMNDIYIVPEN